MDGRRFVALIAAALSGCTPPVARPPVSNAPTPKQSVPNVALSSFESIEQLESLYRSQSVGVERVVSEAVDRIYQLDRRGPTVKSVAEVNPDAMAIARALERDRRPRETLPLYGIPILLKENINTADRMSTTAGSFALVGNVPVTDATVVRRLRDAGAVILGKANMTELAVDTTGLPSARSGLVRNPHRLDRLVGGSSSGPAAGVAGGFAVAALASDTRGSARIPSSYAGVVGLRPTMGLVSRRGLMPLRPDSDTIAPMARSVRDLAILTSVLAGSDVEDPLTAEADRHRSDYATGLTPDGLSKLRVGIVRGVAVGLEPAVAKVYERALADLRKLGTTVVEIDEDQLPDSLLPKIPPDRVAYEAAVATEHHLRETTPESPVRSFKQLQLAIMELPVSSSFLPGVALSSAQENLMDFGETDLEAPKRWSSLAADTKERLAQTRPRFAELMLRLGIDYLFFPTTAQEPLEVVANPRVPPAEGKSTSRLSSLSHTFGIPELTVPAGMTENGLPQGVSFVGPAFSEAGLFKLAHAFEQVRGPSPRPDLSRPCPKLDIAYVKPPLNDSFAAAEPMKGDAGTLRGSTFTSTAEPQEPRLAGPVPLRSVWYRFSPATSGELFIESVAVGRQQFVGLYKGTQLERLEAVPLSGSKGSKPRSAHVAGAGTYYVMISAARFDGPKEFELRWRFAGKK